MGVLTKAGKKSKMHTSLIWKKETLELGGWDQLIIHCGTSSGISGRPETIMNMSMI
jgi:hypothetical protein